MKLIKSEKKNNTTTSRSPFFNKGKDQSGAPSESPDSSFFQGPSHKNSIQRKPETPGHPAPDSSGHSAQHTPTEHQLSASRGAGAPLPEGTKQEMESSFGADFSQVRIHDDQSAANMNKDLDAQAFTHGKDVYFDSGKYDPKSKGGQQLLAHELTHTIQQGTADIQKFGAGEHMEVAREGSIGPRGETRMVQLADDYEITYQVMVAMAADHFESIAQMRQFAANNGKGAGTREEIEYVRQVKMLHWTGSNSFSESAVTAADKRYYDLALKNRSHFLNPTQADFKKTADDKGLDLLSEFRMEGWRLLKAQSPQNSVAGYRYNHMQALGEAYMAGQNGTTIDKAMAVEAFGMHYLTDSFAAGHVITPRADISTYWDSRFPMFNYNLKGWIAQKMSEELSDTKAWGLASREMVYSGTPLSDSALEIGTNMLDAKGTLRWGDVVSGALHDYYNLKGVMVRINGELVRTFGDGYLNGVKDDDGNTTQVNGARKYIPDAVRLSLQDVEMAWEAGNKHQLPLNVVESLIGEHMFEAEKLLPVPVAESELPEEDKPIRWQYENVKELLEDSRFSEALKIFANDKAGEFEEVANGMKDKKKRHALMNQVVKPLKNDPVGVVQELWNWTPDTGGGFMSHNQDDNAMDYYEEAKSNNALGTLTTIQRGRVIKHIVEGFFNYVSGDEENAVMKLFETAPPGERRHIYRLVEGHRWTGDWIEGWFTPDDDIYNGLSDDNLKKLRNLINEG